MDFYARLIVALLFLILLALVWAGIHLRRFNRTVAEMQEGKRVHE